MLKKWFKEYFEINKREILIIICLLIIGIIVGFGTYIFASNELKDTAVLSIKEVFDISKSESYIKTNIMLNGITAHLVLIIVICLLSLTLFGKWIIYGIIILKGMAISIYSILLFNVFGPLWGIVAFILLVVLVNMLYIPAFMYLIVCFLEVNFNIFKTKFNNINIAAIYKVLIIMLLSFVVMFSSVVVEQIASNIVLNIYTKM